MEYRTDIDGLRALAVTAVILFHLGYLANGYLGVDIFFVISGFLITNIIYGASTKQTFSVLTFYQRRIRRIIPLLLFISFTALLIGIMVMLPEDLENLAQSVVASNFSVNNLLMYITSGNYWATKNEFKPLMHTWSLGVEEQFYLIYPFIFYFFQGTRSKVSIYIIATLTVLSLAAYLLQAELASRFYLIQYRFFELSIGGLGTIYLFHSGGRLTAANFLLYPFVAITLILLLVPVLSIQPILNVLITLSTAGVLVFGSQHVNKAGAYSYLFQNKAMVGLGKISYSVYMWHQLVFAFARYTFLEEITVTWSILLTLLILLLATVTYYLVESPFRNHQLIQTKYVLATCGAALLITTLPAFYIHAISGVVRDYPELGFSFDQRAIKKNLLTSNRNECIRYIDAIDRLDKDFSEEENLKVLVIGNSFGRDVSNILLEYDSQKRLEVRYFRIANLDQPTLKKRLEDADKIILAAKDILDKTWLKQLEQKQGMTIDMSKVWVFGTKDFGYHNGVHHFRHTPKTDFQSYRTRMKEGVQETNHQLSLEWSDRYVDLISVVSDKNDNVLVYTPEGKFLSHDTLHLTKYGAIYYAKKLRSKLNAIFFPGIN